MIGWNERDMDVWGMSSASNVVRSIHIHHSNHLNHLPVSLHVSRSSLFALFCPSPPHS